MVNTMVYSDVNLFQPWLAVYYQFCGTCLKWSEQERRAREGEEAERTGLLSECSTVVYRGAVVVRRQACSTSYHRCL